VARNPFVAVVIEPTKWISQQGEQSIESHSCPVIPSTDGGGVLQCPVANNAVSSSQIRDEKLGHGVALQNDLKRIMEGHSCPEQV
jgi:hypothetical protein